MKFRKDFVTNSSSSSYVCEICGRSESGWDIGLSECEMMECVNGHVFCCYEALERPTKKEMIKIIMENAWNRRWSSTTYSDVEVSEDELLEMDEDTLFDDFMSDGGYYEVPNAYVLFVSLSSTQSTTLAHIFLRNMVFQEMKYLQRLSSLIREERNYTRMSILHMFARSLI